MAKKSERTIKRNIRELRKFMDTSDDVIATRIAYAVGTAVRWATEDTVGWPGLLKQAQDEAEMLRQEIREPVDRSVAVSLVEKLPTTEELDNLDDDDFSGRRVCPLNLTIAEVRALRELLEALTGKENRKDDNA